MSNYQDDVLEGFLCPICMEDLVSITQLQVHFDELHGNEDQAVLQSLKGFFNRAKKKLLNEDEELEGSFTKKLRNPYFNELQDFGLNNPWEWDAPENVSCKSHEILFKKLRSARIDSHVAETNKLLIRLDKLLTEIPSDPGKRKVHEKDLVPWVNDKDVPLCPFCARGFNLARRRHHCRLCGGIMCDDCSQFLSFSSAKRLVSPVHHGKAHVGTKEDHGKIFGSLLGGLRRSGSHGSLNSLLAMMDSLGKENNFRICSHCLLRLNARERQVDQKNSKILLSVYYEKLMAARNQVSNNVLQYSKMVDSLLDGETTYNLHDAEELRIKILRLSDVVSMSAQKIRSLGAAGVTLDGHETPTAADGEKVSAGPRQELLQKRIHSAAAAFLKSNVLTLAKLPSSDQVIARRNKRRMETDARLAAEKEAATQAEERATMILKRRKANEEVSRGGGSSVSPSSSAYSTPRRKPKEQITVDTGWGADTSNHGITETDDPLIQQMNIIRNFIKQARDACKYDEVSLLETNLKELQLEFKKQQNLMDP